jgi:4-amino-4-deoxy-L-arabinose transferase-like glycosyltransferase
MPPSRLRHGLDNAIDRLCGRLADPERGARAVALTLAVYVALWTLYGALAKANQDLFPDMAEELVWARYPALGYFKHPPLSAYLVRLWFSIVPRADWTFYLLAILVAALALWAAWKQAGDYLSGEKRVLALALLTLVPFFNFHALKYNVNSVLMPLWAATTFWFLRSYRARGLGYAALAGVGAAAAMLCKYWSVFLLAGLAVAALIDRRRGLYFRSAAPWVTVAVGFVLLSPHLVWLVQHDYLPIHYALVVHGHKTLTTSLHDALGYLAGAAGYGALPVVLVLIAARPGGATLADMIWPQDDDRRFVAAAFLAPLLLPALAAIVSGVAVNSLWSMPAWTLLPLLLLSPRAVVIPAAPMRWILGIAIGFPVVMVLAAPVIAYVNHRSDGLPVSAQSRLISARVEQAWREVSAQPLRYVDGDISYGIAVYAADRPRPLPDLPPVEAGAIKRAGLAVVCLYEDGKCTGEARLRHRREPASRWTEVTLRRVFWGVPGRPQRYAILIIPPLP